MALPPWLRRGTKVYDLLAGAPLVLFYGLSAIGRVNSLWAELSALNSAKLSYAAAISILSNICLLCVAFLFVVCVLLRPPPLVRVKGIMPRIAAVAGTYLAVWLMLVPSGNPPDWIVSISTALVLCGTAFAAYAIFYLGRSVSLVAEARALVTGGPYRIVRHPLYLGEQAAIAGVVFQYMSMLAVFVYVVQLAFQFYRMNCEEAVLSAAFPNYPDYARRTWRILPGLY